MTTILIDVVPSHSPSGNLSGRSVLPEAFSRRCGEIANSLAAIGEAFKQRLDRVQVQDAADWGLAEVTVVLGLAVQAESGVVITKASTGATFTATLTWRCGQRSGSP
jgi:hypothetical protein